MTKERIEKMLERVRFIRMVQVEELTGLRKSSIYDLEKRGDFPQRVRLTQRASGWVEAEVLEWNAKRSEQRRVSQVRA